MLFVSAGFLFLLLPAAVVLYYCTPSSAKSTVLAVISLFFITLLDPRSLFTVLLLLPDFFLVGQITKKRDFGEAAKSSVRLCVIKNICAGISLAVIIPVLSAKLPPIGSAVMLICSTHLLLLAVRGSLTSCSAIDTASSILFFPRLIFGPVSATKRLISQLFSPVFSLTDISRGIMLIISGVAKRVILVEQLDGIFKTISRVPASDYSVILSWLCALCGAMQVYFTLSAVSDLAQGIALVFSISIPKTTYYPFQACGIREYIYRLNMPLEDCFSEMLFPASPHDSNNSKSRLLSLLMPFLLVLLISPSGGGLLLGFYLTLLAAADMFIFSRFTPSFKPFLRLLTFIVALPGFILLLPTTLYARLGFLLSLVGLGTGAFFNETALYLIFSNLLLLLISLILCTSLISDASRYIEKKSPPLWWLGSAVFYCLLLFVTISFLLWKVM